VQQHSRRLFFKWEKRKVDYVYCTYKQHAAVGEQSINVMLSLAGRFRFHLMHIYKVHNPQLAPAIENYIASFISTLRKVKVQAIVTE